MVTWSHLSTAAALQIFSLHASAPPSPYPTRPTRPSLAVSNASNAPLPRRIQRVQRAPPSPHPTRPPQTIHATARPRCPAPWPLAQCSSPKSKSAANCEKIQNCRQQCSRRRSARNAKLATSIPARARKQRITNVHKKRKTPSDAPTQTHFSDTGWMLTCEQAPKCVRC